MPKQQTISEEQFLIEQGGYIVEIMQDGSGVILFETSPPGIVGICTTGLQTCFAVVIIGSAGIALVHDTEKLSKSSYTNLIPLIGKVEKTHVFYNPHLLDRPLEDFILRLASDDDVIFTEEALEIHEVQSHSLFVFASRGKEVRCTVEMNSRKNCCMENPILEELRSNINLVNNFFLAPMEFVDADLQYDGRSFTGFPRLKKTDKEISALTRAN